MPDRSPEGPSFEEAVVATRAGPLALLAIPDFRLAWIAGAIASAMRWLEAMTVSVFVFQLSGSALTVALVLFLRMLPAFLFGAIAGALVERLDRKRLLAAGLAGLGVLSAILGGLVAADAVRLWQVSLGVFLTGLFWALDFPVRRSMLGEIAGFGRLGPAMGLDSTTVNAMRLVGPLVGGVLLTTVGMAGAYLLGAVCYGVSAALIVAVRFRPAPRPGEGPLLANVRAGLVHIRARPLIVGTLVVTVIMNLFAFPYTGMVPVIATTELGLDAFLIGVLMSCEGAGAFLGAVVIAWRATPTAFTRVYVGGAGLSLLGVLSFSLSGSFAAATAALFCAGLGMAGFGTMQPTIVYAATPPRYRQRVLGVLAVCVGAGPLGVLQIGLLADRLGAPLAVTVSALVGVAAMIAAMALWPMLAKAEDPARQVEGG